MDSFFKELNTCIDIRFISITPDTTILKIDNVKKKCPPLQGSLFVFFVCAKQGLNLNQQNLLNKLLIQFGLIALLRPGAKLFVLKLKLSFNKRGYMQSLFSPSYRIA